MSRRSASWLTIGFDTWMLGLEASTVVGLRMAKLASGGTAAETEGRRMVEEKVKALSELQMLALTGGLGLTSQRAASKSLAHYRRKVRANRRRLSKT